MNLGAFSISLAVKDLRASQSFYEELGFQRTGGDGTAYVMMVNGDAVIEMTTDTDPAGTGPAHIMMQDPDGNPILIDQFFPKPGDELTQ